MTEVEEKNGECLLAYLQARGFVMTLPYSNALCIEPADALTPEEVTMIKTHSAALLRAFQKRLTHLVTGPRSVQ
jgi:hypothetical protein